MKKWNKKMCIFFSLFFIFFLSISPSVLLLAAESSDSAYVPDSSETYYFSRSFTYDEGKYQDGQISSRTDKYFSSNSEIIIILENDRLTAFSVENVLNGGSSGEFYVSKCSTNGYSDSTVTYSTTVKEGPITLEFCEYYDVILDSEYFGNDTHYCGFSTNIKIFSSRDSAISYAKTGDLSGLLFDPSETEDLTDSNSVYSPDIGYLQNVQIHTRGVKDDDGETDYLTYDTITNTGFDIKQEGVRVSLYTKYQGYYFENWTEWIGDNNAHKWVSERKYQKSVDGSSDKFFYEYTKLFDVHADDKAKNESLNKSLLVTPFGKIEYWLRLEKKNSDGIWTYGGWVSMADTKASMTEGDKQTKTYDNEENLDPDGGYGTGTDTYQDYGEGNTAEEADEKAFELPDSQKDLDNFDSGYETMDSFVDGIKSMKNGLGDVPKIISEVFKALPTPVITAIGCGFFLAIVLRILGR